MLENSHYIRRCHELAMLGIRNTSPNPVVGAVIVTNKEIIGEGWHRAYGEDHAEICALKDIQTSNRTRISDSTIFVSLEPCSIFGKTPPCTEAILREKIKEVVVSSRDLTKGVDQVSEYILKEKGLKVSYGIGHQLGDIIAAPRNVFTSKKRPYFILKWAQSADGFISKEGQSTAISNAFSLRYVHQLRSEVDAILVGKNTVIIDNPSLTNRYYLGKNPLRIVLGKLNRSDHSVLNIFSDNEPVLIFGNNPNQESKNQAEYIQINSSDQILATLCDNLYERSIQKVLIEGGTATLQSFISAGLWDECRIITNPVLLDSGIPAPILKDQKATQSFNLMDDRIDVYLNF